MACCKSLLTVSRAIVLAAIAVATSIVTLAQLRAQEESVKADAEPSKLASDLVGTWELVADQMEKYLTSTA
jgi:hypothetical protein